MKASEALKQSKIKLQSAQIPSYQIDALILLCFTLNLSKEQVIFNPSLELSEQQNANFSALIERRIKREPISHIIGKREFFGQDFQVNSAVLDPRPDSETLIETVLSQHAPTDHLKLLELGVGSACLLLTLLSKLNNARGIGVDISQQALQTAIANSKLLKLEERVEFRQSNWFENLKNMQFDLIISNPPYIKSQDIETLESEVRDYEPRLALDGGADGLDCYRAIAADVNDFLKDDASLVLEIGQGQEQEIEQIFQKSGLVLVKSVKDLGQIIRCLVFKKCK